jgi:hypothetical protein
MDSAVVHLHQIHFQGTELTSEELQRWIRRGDKVDSFQLQCDAKRLLDTVLDHCTHLRTLKDEVIAGVCGSGKFDSAVYRLPNGLVRAFERILTMMAYSGYAASLSVREYHESPERFRRFFASTHQNHIVDLGYGAEAAFDEAKSNLMLMSRVQEYSNSIQFDTVGPEYMVLVLLAGLKDRGVNQPLNLAQLHRKELNRLVSRVFLDSRRLTLLSMTDLSLDVRSSPPPASSPSSRDSDAGDGGPGRVGRPRGLPTHRGRLLGHAGLPRLQEDDLDSEEALPRL